VCLLLNADWVFLTGEVQMTWKYLCVVHHVAVSSEHSYNWKGTCVPNIWLAAFIASLT